MNGAHVVNITKDRRSQSGQVSFRLCLAVAGLGLLLSACGSSVSGPDTARPRESRSSAIGPQAHYKIGAPYAITGIWYYPRAVNSYDETGIASWYGPNFHKKTTANGEIFDQNALTAAHRTLPMPSIVRVTNLENGRELVVRVNDRGPFIPGRIIDLSRRSAQLLGFERHGIARTRVQYLPGRSRTAVAMIREGRIEPAIPTDLGIVPVPDAKPQSAVSVGHLTPIPGSVLARQNPDARSYKPVAANGAKSVSATDSLRDSKTASGRSRTVVPTQLFVQVAAFAIPENAEALSATLSDIGRIEIRAAVINRRRLHQVRIGPVDDVTEADVILTRVIERGFPKARIVVNSVPCCP